MKEKGPYIFGVYKKKLSLEDIRNLNDDLFLCPSVAYFRQNFLNEILSRRQELVQYSYTNREFNLILKFPNNLMPKIRIKLIYQVDESGCLIDCLDNLIKKVDDLDKEMNKIIEKERQIDIDKDLLYYEEKRQKEETKKELFKINRSNN